MNNEFRGDRLAILRKAKGMTQTELANALEINQNQISSYEREIALPTIRTLMKMAQLFDTSADYLIGLTNKQTPDAEAEPYVNRHEAAMLEIMRAHNDREQAWLVRVVQVVLERNGKQQ